MRSFTQTGNCFPCCNPSQTGTGTGTDWCTGFGLIRATIINATGAYVPMDGMTFVANNQYSSTLWYSDPQEGNTTVISPNFCIALFATCVGDGSVSYSLSYKDAVEIPCPDPPTSSYSSHFATGSSPSSPVNDTQSFSSGFPSGSFDVLFTDA